MKAVLFAGLLTCSLMTAQPLAQRIGHTDPSKYNVSKPVHAGAGELHYMTLLPRDAVFNLNFMHRGIILPKSGIGHHFHNNSEEMFLIFGGEAEFTVDGRTSRVQGPVGVNSRAGHSHAIYNPGNRPLEWMNINFRAPNAPASLPGRGGPGGPGGPGGRGGRGGPPAYDMDPTATFDLGDDRVGVPLDPVPVFITTRLYKDLLQPVAGLNGGKGTVLYRRALGPAIYTGNWAFVDHLVLPPGSSVGRHRHQGVEEIYYVMNGEGTVAAGAESAPIRRYDAVPIRAKEVHALENTGPLDLELMVVGVALEKGKLDSEDVK
jgi:mannose-6-phosphate isomerase-like protein (cupin superfamily)